jgi:hypothetical protein
MREEQILQIYFHPLAFDKTSMGLIKCLACICIQHNPLTAHNECEWYGGIFAAAFVRLQ